MRAIVVKFLAPIRHLGSKFPRNSFASSFKPSFLTALGEFSSILDMREIYIYIFLTFNFSLRSILAIYRLERRHKDLDTTIFGMVRAYDNWEKLVEATLKREQLREIARCPSFSSTSSDFSSRLSFSSLHVQLEEFSLQELLKATNSFSEDNIVDTGSFGLVYYGTLDDGRVVTITRAKTSSSTKQSLEGKDQALVNELNHKNLVRPLVYCKDRNMHMLVYEYVSNTTLYNHLHNLLSSPLMSGPTRIKVALDAERGVEYLHEYAVPPVIHGDINSSNILLEATWTAKVSDFGLSLMGPQDDQSHLSLRAVRTVGYMDPEYYRLQQLTTESDVYSFGVVLLELLSGHKAIHKNENGVPRNVVDDVVPYIIQDEIHRGLDGRVPLPTPVEIEAVAYVGYLAADCVVLEGQDRPSMREVVNSLDIALEACLAPPGVI